MFPGCSVSFLKKLPSSSYFGPRNSLPVVDILTRAGFDNATIEHAAYTIDYFARMPYSNNWRVNPREGRAIVANCPGCTVPARSGNKAMAIADTLNKQWGVQVGHLCIHSDYYA